ncbi:hypothetical protein SSS_05079 [Sarcoptes scabiei]|uniref:MA3 domain containing protein n=1 Tax=Sarcoptes scabiei TaxID=52283 RepID=A0A132AE52_SARSC|nr:hypothetical protein SSS_05079 [Sarcoptes scabiei]KPM08835.1 MA3 domain containing protein [Sarcoptes scabiei]
MSTVNQSELFNGDVKASSNDIEKIDDVSSSTSSQSNKHHHHHHHHQAKRIVNHSTSNDLVQPSSSPTEAHMKKFMKNSRRSRSRFGRGLAKKGGAGGKGTWGKICENYSGDGCEVLDPNDPNYDSDTMENYKIEAITPVLEPEEIDKCVRLIVAEYYEHGDSNEAIDSLLELNFGERLHSIIVIAISMALEKKNAYREMTSVLISDLYGQIVHQEEIEKGFDELLDILPDLILDTPNAAELLGNFIARAVADDILPPIYVKNSQEKYLKKPQKFSIDIAKDLLSSKHGLINVDRIWGFTGGMRPVKYLIKQMHMILEEYLVSNIADDAGTNLTDLEVPHFHHEFVYEAIVKAIEDSKEPTIDKICSLLKFLYDTGVITIDQLKNGYLRVFEEMPEIVIDVPYAYEILETIKSKAEKLDSFPEELVKEMPTRGRKRFVSEGDGGTIKS